MNRYLKDPVILFSVVGWLIAFVVFTLKITTPQGARSAAAPASSGSTHSASLPNTGASATTASTASSSEPVLIPISRRTPGEIFVSKLSNADTSDLTSAISQVKPDEKIVVDAGTYELGEYPYFATPEHITIVGAGPDTIIRLHSSMFVKGVTRIEKAVIEGPNGETAISVRGSGTLSLTNVMIRNAAFGILLENISKLYAENLKIEKVDSNCINLHDDSKAAINASTFSDCFTAIASSSLSTADVKTSHFERNRLAFLISDDRNHATCLDCGFDTTVHEKVNVTTRLILSEKSAEVKNP